jgi:uncharacterized BrkB/YihY/UPF0761 family membrane protein
VRDRLQSWLGMAGRVASMRRSFETRRATAAARLEELRRRTVIVDLPVSVFEHDLIAGGYLLAGALAFRLFLLLLPMTLVVVAGLGFAAAEDPTSPATAASDLGVTGLAASSVRNAAHEAAGGRWVLLILGLFFLAIACRSAARVLRIAHAFVWREPVERVRTRADDALGVLFAAAALLSAASVVAAIRHWSNAGGLVAIVLMVLVYFGIWLAFSARLPHGDAPLRALIPGAILVAVGLEGLHIFTAYWLPARIEHGSHLYGALGVAAALLVYLLLVGRLIVTGASLNAVLWNRSHREPST